MEMTIRLNIVIEVRTMEINISMMGIMMLIAYMSKVLGELY
jgi:hypothetical protein